MSLKFYTMGKLSMLIHTVFARCISPTRNVNGLETVYVLRKIFGLLVTNLLHLYLLQVYLHKFWTSMLASDEKCARLFYIAGRKLQNTRVKKDAVCI